MDRALLVGINSYPTCPLNGCINDVQDMASFICAERGFAESSVRLLTDLRATREEILSRLWWLVTGARKGDRLFFHYSGHGAQMPIRNAAGQVYALSDVICPVDFDWSLSKAISDDDFQSIFSTVPVGVEFVWVSDSCNSGGLDPSVPTTVQAIPTTIKTVPMPADIAWRYRTARSAKITPRGFAGAARENNVAFLAGCGTQQSAADACINGRYNGAFTYYLLKKLSTETGRQVGLAELIKCVASLLADEHFPQEPVIVGPNTLVKHPFLIRKFGRKN